MSPLCTDMCISCGSLNVSLEHPLFIGAMCQNCKVQHTPHVETNGYRPKLIGTSVDTNRDCCDFIDTLLHSSGLKFENYSGWKCSCFLDRLYDSGSVCGACRTASWSVRISMTMMATSPTAPSAVGGERCSCVGTTTAAGVFYILEWTI